MTELRVNGRIVKFGDEVIYLIHKGATVTRVPVRIVNVTAKRVIITHPSWFHNRKVSHGAIEGYEVPVSALFDGAGLNLGTLQVVKGWFRDSTGPEHDAFYEVREKVDEAITKLTGKK